MANKVTSFHVQLWEEDWRQFGSVRLSPREVLKKGIIVFLRALFGNSSRVLESNFLVYYVTIHGDWSLVTDNNLQVNLTHVIAAKGVHHLCSPKAIFSGKNVFGVKFLPSSFIVNHTLTDKGEIRGTPRAKHRRESREQAVEERKKKRRRLSEPSSLEIVDEPEQEVIFVNGKHLWIDSRGQPLRYQKEGCSKRYGMSEIKYDARLRGTLQYVKDRYGAKALYVKPNQVLVQGEPFLECGGIQCVSCRREVKITQMWDLSKTTSTGKKSYDKFATSHAQGKPFNGKNVIVEPCDAWLPSVDGLAQTKIKYKRRKKPNVSSKSTLEEFVDEVDNGDFLVDEVDNAGDFLVDEVDNAGDFLVDEVDNAGDFLVDELIKDLEKD